MKFTRRQKGLFGIVFIACLILLSWIGLSKLYPESNTLRYLPDRIYRIIKIVFGGDPSSTSLEQEDVPWELILAKVFAIGILLFGAFKIIQKVFSEQYNLLVASFKNKHTVTIGISKKGRQLLHSLKDDQQEKAIVIERTAEHANINSVKKEGHLVLIGDAEEKNTLMEARIKRAKRLIVFLENEQAVIEIMETTQEIYRKCKPEQLLKCYIHLRNPRLIDLMKNAGLRFEQSNMEMHFFNIQKMVARAFFAKLPLIFRDKDWDIQQLKKVIFLGYGEYAKALMIQTLRIFHLHEDEKLEILIYSDQAERDRNNFKEQFPKADHVYPIQFKEFKGSYQELLQENQLQQDNQNTLFIVASDDDQSNLNHAIEILYKTKGFSSFPIFCLNTEGKGLRSLISQEEEMDRLYFFGNMEDTCHVEFITGEKQDILAQAIHDDYRKLLAGSSSESSSYTSDWLTLSEDAKDASRTQADHIIYKLLLTKRPLIDPKDEDLVFNAEELERLAIIEHNRWMAHRYMQGWDFANQRDDLLKLHPSLIAWEDLSESERQKDRDTIIRLKTLFAALKK
ncbi:NAD-binding protein [Sphingobacterium lactis]|uniref:NAD-binding protein n=1 Tax=Sphingobacterium lactis TaxID=797291 RepID=UPI003F7FB64A